ncbi:MAG: iron-sulfur binding hydrogenase [Candidatus Cryosericum sp.]|nr:iron-sulfur binding hydrogenase [bacterium]
MTVQEVIGTLDAEIAVQADLTKSVTHGYTCDLLSEVIAKALPGSAWATIQTHLNVVAVASMVGISVIIVCEGRTCEPDVIERAVKEQISILYSRDSAFLVSGKLYALGLR